MFYNSTILQVFIPDKLPNKGINLIPAFHSDAPEIAEMMEEFYEMFGYPFERELALDNIRLFIQDQSLGRLWLLKQDDQVVGYAAMPFRFSFGYGGKDALLDEFYLKKEYRNKGLGEEYLKLILDEAEKFDLSGMHLEVEKKNFIARDLYVKYGFEKSDLDWYHKEFKK